MAVSFRVQGPAIIYIDDAELGVSTDGVTIDFKHNTQDVFIDTFGGQGGTPADVQHMLGEGKVSCELVYYDKTVLESVLAMLKSGTFGTTGSAGTLLFTQSKAMKVTVNATPAGGLTGSERCYTFPNAYLLDASGKFGTKVTKWNISWRCLPGIPSGDTSAGLSWITTACS